MGVGIRTFVVALLACCRVESFAIGSCASSYRSSRPTRLSSRSSAEHADDTFLLDLLMPARDCKVDQMSPTDLAYIGDAVYELLVRSRTVWPSKKTSNLQTLVVGLVRAEHQSLLLGKLRQNFDLTTAEQQVLSRGRNASTGSSKNRRNPAAYQDSTALEALVGYLFITDRKRCQQLLSWIHDNLDDVKQDDYGSTTS